MNQSEGNKGLSNDQYIRIQNSKPIVFDTINQENYCYNINDQNWDMEFTKKTWEKTKKIWDFDPDITWKQDFDFEHHSWNKRKVKESIKLKEAEISVSENEFLDMDDKKFLNLFMKELGIDRLNPQSEITIDSHTYESLMNSNIATK